MWISAVAAEAHKAVATFKIEAFQDLASLWEFLEEGHILGVYELYSLYS